jgi:hypothetical protein
VGQVGVWEFSMGIFPVLGMELEIAVISFQYLDQYLNPEHLVRSEI